MDDPLDDDSENLLVKLTSLVVLGVGLTTLFLGFEWFWVVFAVGFAVVVPMVKVLTKALGIDGGAYNSEHKTESRPQDHTAQQNSTADQFGTRTSDTESKQDALDTLRNRYARGDLTEAEFERKVETLLETETPESARKRVGSESSSARETESLHETETNH
jgi:hypothetical protein